MGSFLQTITQLHHQQPSLFYQKLTQISQPIDRIKQHYGLFKSICDSFLITKDKYLQIFQSSKNLQIWDREQTNKLDALELFTGLVVHSQATTFRQKLKFLFVIFDFNEIRNLSFVDLQYATLCLCNATFKILGKNAKTNQTQIVSWLRGYFYQKQRINITKLYAFCIQSAQVRRFFQIVTKQQHQTQVLKQFLSTNQQPINSLTSNKLSSSYSTSIPTFRQSRKQIQQKLQWHKQFSKKLAVPYNPTNYLHKAEMSWVYGVRVQGLYKPFLLIQKRANKHQMQLLYTTSSLMILYNLKTNKQRYYTGHGNKLISAFVYNQTKRLIISASQNICQRSIHIWSYQTLQCIKIIDTYKPVKSLSLLGKDEQMLVVICDNLTNTNITTNNNLLSTSSSSKHTSRTTIMIFSLQSQYSLIYTYSYEQSTMVDHLSNIYTTIDSQQIGNVMNVWDSFVAVCGGAVVFTEVVGNKRGGDKQRGRGSNNAMVVKTTAYEYYQQPTLQQQRQEQQHSTSNNNNNNNNHNNDNNSPTNNNNYQSITCSLSLYITQQHPSLRTLITSQQSLNLFILTGHQNGQLKCVVYNSDGQFGGQQVLFDCLLNSDWGSSSHYYQGNSKNVMAMKSNKRIVVGGMRDEQQQHHHEEQHQTQNPLTKPITCLQHTQTHIMFSHSSNIIIFPLSYLITKDQSLIRTINIMNYSNLKLFNTNIEYFTCLNDKIIVVTEREGDFVMIEDRKIVFNTGDMVFTQIQSVTRIKTLTKIDNTNHSQSLCILQKPQSQQHESSPPLLYLTTQDRRILIINTATKQVQNIWQINSPNDKITAIDTVYTDDDVLYFVCGCQSGRLYIRVDNQQNPRFYDCSARVVDVKISKDAAYLLVSTVQKYLFFFTQINKNFSSPRKLHFENEIPMCINFLDSNKMFTVNTSAKNIYVIEIPQLKHKNIQKQTQRISISKMKILYPSIKASYQSVFANNYNTNNINVNNKKSSSSLIGNSTQKHSIYTKSYLGGQLKYFLITLNTGQLMFFQSRQHLPVLSYVTLSGHCGEIANLGIAQGQQQFYTLGRYDNTLIEWGVRPIHTIVSPSNQSMRSLIMNDRGTMYQIQQFQRMKQISCYYKLLNSARNDDIYLFKGTKNQKLNQTLRKSLKWLNNSNSNNQNNVITGDNNINNASCDNNDDVINQQPMIIKTTQQLQQQTLKPYMPKYKLNLRQPNISLQISQIYGLECYKRSSVAFWGDDDQNNLKILYFTSRFLLSLDVSSSYKRQQKVVEQEKHKLSCFVITEQNKILYALAERNTKIRFHGQDNVLWTTHQLGIIHLAVYKKYVLSYGILANSSYSVNLHNYKTRQLISKRTTDIKIHELIFINQQQFISLNEIRIWKDMYPSQRIGKATAGILMPNLTDICLGTDNGSISILNPKKGIFTVVTKAHQSDIICITINKFDSAGFQILTVSKDDKIKVWNEKFSCKLMINLRDQLLKNVTYLPETEVQRKHGHHNQTDRLKHLTKQLGKQNMHHYKSLNIRGIDSRKGRVLIYLASGQVYVGRFTLINRQNHLQRTVMQENSLMRDSQDDDGSSANDGSQESIDVEVQRNAKRKRDNVQYEKQWQKVIQSHCCQTQSIFRKSLAFTIHPSLPILVSVGGNDKKLLFRNYQTSQIIDTYFSQQSGISCLKYSKRGNLLILGFKNGNVKIYTFDVRHKQGVIVKGVELRFSQKFSIKQDMICQAISIQVSQKSMYIAVSFIGHHLRGSGNDSVSKQNQLQQQQSSQPQPTQPQQSIGFVNIYKLKSSQQSQQQSNPSNKLSSLPSNATYQQTYYSLVDTLRIKELDSSLFSTGKYIRCVCEMQFVGFKQKEFGLQNQKKEQKSQKTKSNKLSQLSKQQQSRQNIINKQQLSSPSSSQPTQSMCIILYQQYINQNMIRVNNSQRDRFIVYSLQQRTYLKRQFQQVNWSKVRFPSLINVLQLNKFMSEIVMLGQKQRGRNLIGDNNVNNQDYNNQYDTNNNFITTNNSTNQQQANNMFTTTNNNNDNTMTPLTITSMCYYNQSTIIYGGTHGKLHLVRLSSLLTQQNQTLLELKQHQMSTCKTYPSQASFIAHLELSNDKKYLFVAGQLDEDVVKYNVIEFTKPQQTQLDYQQYDTYRQQQSQIYITKDKFYNFINSLSPLREGIRNVLQDVQGFDYCYNNNNNSNNYSKMVNDNKNSDNSNDVGLEIMKVIGRRAYDRMNNLFTHQDYLIYTLGPNLILQHIMDPFMQKLLPSDPNPLSHNPQISTIHMKKHSNILILATQQQSARLFVWDIRAMICLSEMQVNCSIIYGLKLIGERYAVFYGVNSMYQLIVEVIDWRLKRVVALCNLLHSAVWKIRDICVLQGQSQNIDQNSIRFVTCGVQHLSEWSIKSNTLIQKHFTNIPIGTTLTVITHINCNLVITGCQRGNIYLWKNYSWVQQLKAHSGPIRSIEIVLQTNTVLTGGMDSIVCVLRYQDDQLYVQGGKSINPKVQDIGNTSNVDESSRGQQKQSGPSQLLLQQGSFLTQFDIQSIIHTSSSFASSSSQNNNHHSSQSSGAEQCTFFVGTRSGDIYFCQYNMRQKQFISTAHIVYGQDHETIVSAAFDNKEQILFTLTTSGKLEVWELKHMQKTFSYKFMKRAKRLYIYKQYVLICFQKEIIFIQLDIRDKIIKIDETLTLTFDGIISQCVLSYSQCYLGIGLHANQSNQILIYELPKKNLLYHSPSLKYEIEFLDFSTDQKYLLYKDKFQQIGMVYLVTLKRINTIFVEMKLQWQTQGLRISPKAQRIYSTYNCQNRITTIAKLAQNYILVGDQMGTLRVFQYPPNNQKLGELHTQCYTQHMNKINCIKMHRELTYVVTAAVTDRSLVLWRKFGM